MHILCKGMSIEIEQQIFQCEINYFKIQLMIKHSDKIIYMYKDQNR